MRDKLTTFEGVGMTLVVKRIKGKLYVYEEFRVGGKVVTKYVGPLEEIVRTYQLIRLRGQVNYRFTRKDLRRLAKEIAKSVVNSMRNLSRENVGVWWTGRDLNPGPRGCQPRALPG